MTNAELLAKIKAEIERLKKNSELAKMEWVNEGYNQNAFAEDCRIKSFDTLLSFLDTLESENSVPNDRDEAAKEYAKTTFKKPHSDNPDEEVTIVEPDKYAGFIAGAKWDKEQMMSNAVEGTVYGNGVYTWVAGDIPSQFKYGDKVRAIVLPKEN